MLLKTSKKELPEAQIASHVCFENDKQSSHQEKAINMEDRRPKSKQNQSQQTVRCQQQQNGEGPVRDHSHKHHNHKGHHRHRIHNKLNNCTNHDNVRNGTTSVSKNGRRSINLSSNSTTVETIDSQQQQCNQNYTSAGSPSSSSPAHVLDLSPVNIHSPLMALSGEENLVTMAIPL